MLGNDLEYNEILVFDGHTNNTNNNERWKAISSCWMSIKNESGRVYWQGVHAVPESSRLPPTDRCHTTAASSRLDWSLLVCGALFSLLVRPYWWGGGNKTDVFEQNLGAQPRSGTHEDLMILMMKRRRISNH